MMNLPYIIDVMQENLSQLFDEDELDTLAREHRFIVRSTNRIEAIDFVELMTIQLCQDQELSLDGMCDVLESKNPNSRIFLQALQTSCLLFSVSVCRKL